MNSRLLALILTYLEMYNMTDLDSDNKIEIINRKVRNGVFLFTLACSISTGAPAPRRQVYFLNLEKITSFKLNTKTLSNTIIIAK